MPDTNSPKVTMSDEDLSKRLFGNSNDQIPHRRWSCLTDHTLAAYADGGLGNLRKPWVEFHLAGCQRCRVLVAEAVKAQTEMDLPLPPGELRWKAIGLAGRSSAPRRRVWAPAGALVVAALLVAVAVLLRKPEQLITQLPPSPSAPLLAKSEPAVAPRIPVREIVRKNTSEEPLPSIVLPRPDSVVTRERLKFAWKPIPHSRYYEVRVVTTDGDLVWEGQTEKSDLQPPSDVALQNGSYFVWITAYLADGRVAKSSPVKFVVKR